MNQIFKYLGFDRIADGFYMNCYKPYMGVTISANRDGFVVRFYALAHPKHTIDDSNFTIKTLTFAKHEYGLYSLMKGLIKTTKDNNWIN